MIHDKFSSGYLITIENELCIVNNYKYEKCKLEDAFKVLKPIIILVGKSRICGRTEMSGASDSSNFDGITFLVGNNDNKYIFSSGFEIFILSTEDKVVDFISLTGNKMIPTARAVGEKNTYFLFDHYKII